MQTIKVTSRTVFIFLTLIGLLAYFNSFRVPFHYDDIHFLREQAVIKSFSLFLNWITQNYTGIINSRAFLLFTFYLNYVLNGLDTFGYHIANFFIHISTAFLFYLLLSQYVEKEKGDQHHIRSLFAAALFLLHPIAVETVTYISSRSSGLSAFFVLSAMLLFFKATRNTFVLMSYLLSLLCFFLGLATKESAIVTPALILLFDLYFIADQDQKFSARLKYHAPFWLIVFAGAYRYSGYIINPLMHDRSWLTHILTECKAFVEYLRLMIFPSGLTIDHDIKESLSFDRPAILAITIIAALFVLACIVRKKNKVLSFSILWIFVNLAPLFVVRLSDYMAERWAYAALLGFSLGVSWLLFDVFRRYRKIGIAAILGIAVIGGILTHMRNTVFQDPITLWTDAARKAPDKTKAYTNLCGAYLERGDISKAIELCSTAIEKGSDDYETNINLSSAYFYNNDMSKAEAVLLQMANAGASDIYHSNLGIIYTRKKEYHKAIREYQKALKMRPHSLSAMASIGECYRLLHNKKKSDEYYRLAVKEIPQNGEDYLMLAESYSAIGEKEKVAEAFSQALVTEPLNINIRRAIANVYFEKKMYDEAYRHFSIMAKIAPDLVVAYEGMGKAMLAKGELREARRQFNKALSLLPQNSSDRNELLRLLHMAQG